MNETQKTLDALKTAQSNPIADELSKSFTQSGSAISGITYYDLEIGAKLLFPVMTPLRNRISRNVGGMGIQANWRAITGINTNGMGIGVAEGARGAVMAQTTADYLAKFAFMGLENSVTFEADFAAKGFDDVKALAVKNLLQATMIQEEQLDLAGNATLALGTTPTPTVATSTTGGLLPTAITYNVICVALSKKGYEQVAGLNNGTVNQSFIQASATLVPTYTVVDQGSGTSYTKAGGVARKSVATSITTGATSTNSVTASVTAVAGAIGYAWFFGVAGSEVLTAVTSINSVTINNVSASTVNASLFTNDNSIDSTVYDGIMTQILKPGSGSYVKALATGTAGVGTTLTSDGAGGVQEIEDALISFYQNYRLSPDTIYVSASVLTLITKLVIANNGAPLVRFAGDFNGSSSLQAGTSVRSYLNKITGDLIKIEVHPNAAPGTIMFYSQSVPYPLSNTGVLLEKSLRRDYYQMEWPLRTRKYEYGVYFDGVLKNYFPPAFGLIYNIAA
jgi:hypothetical protein